jgi:hypothetical protein
MVFLSCLRKPILTEFWVGFICSHALLERHKLWEVMYFQSLNVPRVIMKGLRCKQFHMHQLWAVLMHAQVCKWPNIAYAIGVLGRYLSDPGLSHWTDAKKRLRYLKGTKDFMLTYRWFDILDAVGYSNENFIDCSDNRRSTSGYTFMMAGGAVLWKVSNRRLQLLKLWRQSI